MKVAQEFLAETRKTSPKDNPRLACCPMVQIQRSRLLGSQSLCLDAERVLRECLAIREKREPDLWTTFNTKAMLGNAL